MDYIELYKQSLEYVEEYTKRYSSVISPFQLATHLDLDKDQYLQYRKEYKLFDDLCKRLELSCESHLIQSLMHSKNDNVKIFLLKSLYKYRDTDEQSNEIKIELTDEQLENLKNDR